MYISRFVFVFHSQNASSISLTEAVSSNPQNDQAAATGFDSHSAHNTEEDASLARGLQRLQSFHNTDLSL